MSWILWAPGRNTTKKNDGATSINHEMAVSNGSYEHSIYY